jgi:AcrR family transcriptional regulator
MTMFSFSVTWSYTDIMPRAFTDTERVAIRERLLAAGQRLFAQRGIRATTVDQLARAAGISKGAYYLFYPSKEALFFAIVEEVETTMQTRLAARVAEAPQDALRLLMRASLNARLENPLFDVAISEEAVAVMRTMSPEDREAFLRRDVDMTESIAGLLAAAGVPVSVSPQLLAGLLRALVFIGMHREDIGAETAPAVEDFLVDALSAALSGAGGARRAAHTTATTRAKGTS